MRLLGTLDSPEHGQRLSLYLKEQGIDNQLDIVTISDWGSENYGDRQAQIWAVDEEQTKKAFQIFEEFIADPDAPRFQQPNRPLKQVFESNTSKDAAKEKFVKIQQAASAWQSQSVGVVTLYLLLTCTLLFMWSVISIPSRGERPPTAPMMILVVSPVTRTLMYDYPKAYEVYQRLYKLYQQEPDLDEQDADPSEDSSANLKPEASRLLKQFRETPVWNGVYDKIVLFVQGQSERIQWNQPLFEKIRQGEAWRIFTPALLHNDIIHLFFNMIWLLVLGKQMESRMGAPRYLLFVLITGSLANTAQYLMSGANFLGFSGVVAAMLGFIYIRQKRAPWEGYQLHRSTLLFITFFILAMLGIQVLSFFSEILWNYPLAPRIANTAHIIGVMVGYYLGKTNFFGWQTSPSRG